jgi:hypothetical protein
MPPESPGSLPLPPDNEIASLLTSGFSRPANEFFGSLVRLRLARKHDVPGKCCVLGIGSSKLAVGRKSDVVLPFGLQEHEEAIRPIPVGGLCDDELNGSLIRSQRNDVYRSGCLNTVGFLAWHVPNGRISRERLAKRPMAEPATEF